MSETLRKVNVHGRHEKGYSFVVTIPHEMAEISKITKGDYVRFELMDKGIMMSKLREGIR